VTAFTRPHEDVGPQPYLRIAGVLALLSLFACEQHGAKIDSSPTFPPVALTPAPPPRLTADAKPAPMVPVADPEPAAPPEPPYEGPISPALKNKALHSPMPGGYLGGWGGDTGIDIAGDHLDVYAVAAGTLDYAEWGHTRWTRGRDTAYSVRLKLDEPIPWGDQKITHIYYTHLSKVMTEQAEGAKKRKHVVAGERIAVSGIGNGTPHLHLGFLLDNEVEQDSWTYILREDAIRKVMGGYQNGYLLPRK
jgi:murein DD-endopeptidase MepM/ murein hydrolase activator NlpD